MRILLLLIALTLPIRIQAQTIEEQLRVMQSELQALRAEVESLKRELRDDQGDSVVAVLPLVQAQVAEHAQTKVESNSKFPVKLFGTITSNTFWNSSNTDWLDIPNVVRRPDYSRGSFSSTMRQTRVGAMIDGPSVGPFKTSGIVAMDFFGGIPTFATGQAMGLPRLLYAYMRLDGERTAFQIGQDHMLLAPKNPTSLANMAFPSLYRSGNLYLRAPQARVEQTLVSGTRGEVRAAAGILAPMAGDFPAISQFALTNRAGERSRTPGVQTRIAWSAPLEGPYEEPQWEFGVAGHYSRERYPAETVSSWAWAADLDLTGGPVGIGGEFFMGQNLDTFGGSVGQDNLDGLAGQRVRSRGGFVEARFALARRLSFNTGYGTNRLYNRPEFTAWRENAGVFGNMIYKFTPEFRSALEYRHQRTESETSSQERNHHFNLTFAYSF